MSPVLPAHAPFQGVAKRTPFPLDKSEIRENTRNPPLSQKKVANIASFFLAARVQEANPWFSAWSAARLPCVEFALDFLAIPVEEPEEEVRFARLLFGGHTLLVIDFFVEYIEGRPYVRLRMNHGDDKPMDIMWDVEKTRQGDWLVMLPPIKTVSAALEGSEFEDVVLRTGFGRMLTLFFRALVFAELAAGGRGYAMGEAYAIREASDSMVASLCPFTDARGRRPGVSRSFKPEDGAGLPRPEFPDAPRKRARTERN